MAEPRGEPGAAATLAEAKAAMRKAAKAALATVAPLSRAEWSRNAAIVAKATVAYKDAGLLLAFLSMATEIDTVPIIEAALSDGKRVAVPRIDGDDIAFVELTAEWRDWPRDRWDIPAPPESCQALSLVAIVSATMLALVPGLAFDDNGGRLGRGKGYYDRFLSGLAAARLSMDRGAQSFIALGYGYRAQLVDMVPMGDSDRRLDGLALG